MTDEELAEFIPCPYMECIHGWDSQGISYEQCSLEWLQSEKE